MMSSLLAKEHIRDVFLLLCGLLLFSSCSTSPEIPKSELNGIWEWTSSGGGWGGVVADSVAYTQTLVIDLDLKEAVFFKNDQIKTRYIMKRERGEIQNRMHWFLYPKKEDFPIRYSADLLAEDELLLRPNCDDCLYHYFKR